MPTRAASVPRSTTNSSIAAIFALVAVPLAGCGELPHEPAERGADEPVRSGEQPGAQDSLVGSAVTPRGEPGTVHRVDLQLDGTEWESGLRLDDMQVLAGDDLGELADVIIGRSRCSARFEPGHGEGMLCLQGSFDTIDDIPAETTDCDSFHSVTGLGEEGLGYVVVDRTGEHVFRLHVIASAYDIGSGSALLSFDIKRVDD